LLIIVNKLLSELFTWWRKKKRAHFVLRLLTLEVGLLISSAPNLAQISVILFLFIFTRNTQNTVANDGQR